MNQTERRAKARMLVQRIACEHGYLGEEVYARMPTDIRCMVEEALKKKDRMIGKSVVTLAKNLYSKDVRFLFELLQNADDNKFLDATSSGAVPYVSFNIHQDRIIVECNEDGFTETNIQAICAVGESSKTGAQGYIGEKGIGFKSVFKVAWKVHIQSGDYSFTFTHRKGDSGMGMISPEWLDTNEALAKPLTRTTLFLHDEGNLSQRQNILAELDDLRPTMLLFLNNLKIIEVHVYDEDGNETWSSILTKKPFSGGFNVLEKTHTEKDKTTCIEQMYHVVETVASNLPPNENREYTAQEESSRAYSKAKVILAFPLSKGLEPVMESQELFAFLPVCRVGFNFIIHSDFCTQANRENIVTTSPRNIRLLDALADAFIVSMRGLCQFDSLRFKWMRYLPKLVDDSRDPFWKILVDKIKVGISEEELLILDDGSTLRRIAQVKQLRRKHRDKEGNPLFADLDEACYISPSYQPSDLAILKDYGLAYLSQDMLLDRVKKDLYCSNSRYKSPWSNDDWHKRVSRLLIPPIETPTLCRIFLERTIFLELVPLTDGQWVSAANVDVHFSSTWDSFPIPGDLGYRLVSPLAEMLQARQNLFTHLGVHTALAKDVSDKIFDKNSNSEKIDFQISLSHLRFLYMAHSEGEPQYNSMMLCDTNGQSYRQTSNRFYNLGFLWKLVKKARTVPDWDNVHFLNEGYFTDPPNKPILKAQNHPTWEDWLREAMCVHEYSPLIDEWTDGSENLWKLSEECQFVAEHLPSDLLNFLEYNWGRKSQITTDEERQCLGNLDVRCRGGESRALSSTYLPLPILLAKRDEFMRQGEFFPFLDIDGNLGEISKWSFLQTLGVGGHADLRFYLHILSGIQAKNFGGIYEPSRVIHLYLRIHEESSHSSNIGLRKARRTTVYDFFKDESGVFIPFSETRNCSWVSPTSCVLDGPVDMRISHPILSIYRDSFPTLDLDFAQLKKFFSVTLKVPNCSNSNIVAELENMSRENCQEFDRILNMYRYLKGQNASSKNSTKLKESFEQGALTFVGTDLHKGWYKPSQCLWSSSTAIRGRVNLRSVYESNMENFFVNTIGVSRLDANVVYQDLLELNPREAAVDDVKDLLRTMSSQIEIKSPESSAAELFQRPILPVRDVNGRVTLRSSDTDFVIIDRKRLGDIFHDSVKMLDFSFSEVCHLHPLIRWAALEDRYISRLVKETSVLELGARTHISDPRQDIKKKAYSLFRIAVHYKSPRVEGDGREFYHFLRAIKTWEVNRISTTLVLSANGEEVTKEVSTGEVHIDDTNGLDIYVPHDETLRYTSYLSTLPKRLAKWIMTGPTPSVSDHFDETAGRHIQGVLSANSSAVEDHLLSNEGIIEVSIPRETEEDVSTYQVVTEEYNNDDVFNDADSSWSNLVGSSTTIGRATRLYKKLLIQVASAAKRSRILADTLDLSTLSEALSSEDSTDSETFGEFNLFRPNTEMERNRRVGAAGELFVFVILSYMNPRLRRFDRDNWTSTIRGYATSHPDFADMGTWLGIETSDLEYEDVDGTLTEALVNKAYLPSSWSNRRPHYYIEVKTTSGTWDTPFYMSHGQHASIQRLSTENSVYVIFRVFNLYTPNIGVNIYVDPARLAREGRLNFSADSWTVTPLAKS